MLPFTYERAQSVDGAIISSAQNPEAKFIAGGTDLLQLMKEEVVKPHRLIDVTGLRSEALTMVETLPTGLRLGALVRMSDAADHPIVRNDYPAVSQALLASASPQVRNMATIGGNLLQRTRCPYFRDIASACNKRDPGSGCSAIGGQNRIHAILGGSDHCIATHASDLAVALAAFDATVVVQGPKGERRVPAEEFHLLPNETPEKENVLAIGELITAVELPSSAVVRKSSYRKVRDRASFEFALASVAVGLDINGNSIADARIALGGVGTKPWRSREAEQTLIGLLVTRETFEYASSIALKEAKPLEHNGFKVRLAHQILVQSLATLAGV